MCHREQVINGCNGKCCECFTLPVTYSDLLKMKAEYSKPEFERNNRILLSNGIRIRLVQENELDKLIEMLIPLGTTNIDPQAQKPFKEVYARYYEDSILDIEAFRVGTENHFNNTDDHDIVANIFTCKHYDKINRLCLNYDNRPHLCRNFGNNCGYEGCSYRTKTIEENNKFLTDESILPKKNI